MSLRKRQKTCQSTPRDTNLFSEPFSFWSYSSEKDNWICGIHRPVQRLDDPPESKEDTLTSLTFPYPGVLGRVEKKERTRRADFGRRRDKTRPVGGPQSTPVPGPGFDFEEEGRQPPVDTHPLTWRVRRHHSGPQPLRRHASLWPPAPHMSRVTNESLRDLSHRQGWLPFYSLLSDFETIRHTAMYVGNRRDSK